MCCITAGMANSASIFSVNRLSNADSKFLRNVVELLPATRCHIAENSTTVCSHRREDSHVTCRYIISDSAHKVKTNIACMKQVEAIYITNPMTQNNFRDEHKSL